MKATHICVICFRLKTSTVTLPGERVKPSIPFTNTGVDYGGPFYIKQGGQRSKIVTKGYIALLICLSTKAIHIELVPYLSTETYIVALSRFTARRNLCTNIYSDNGSNFVGAEKEIRRIMLDKESAKALRIMLVIEQLNFTLCPRVLLTWAVSGKQKWNR
jgi:hypothetical protein